MTSVSLHLELHAPDSLGFAFSAATQVSTPGPRIVLAVDPDSLRTEQVEMKLVSNIELPRVVAKTLQYAIDTINSGLPEVERVDPSLVNGDATVEVDVTDDDVAAFKKAWAEADESLCIADHVEGDRTRAGIRAIFAARAAR